MIINYFYVTKLVPTYPDLTLRAHNTQSFLDRQGVPTLSIIMFDNSVIKSVTSKKAELMW